MTRLYKTLQKRTEKAIRTYSMIQKGDRILVGVSGGPDSLSLLKLLTDGPLYHIYEYSIKIVHVDLGFAEVEPMGWKILESYFQQLHLDYKIVHTQISKSALAPDAKKNPCFICSHYRRKKVYEVALKNNCNKIAYGHHKDDIVETLLLNILYGRKIEAMNPVQEIFKGKMHIIRPFVFIEEPLIKKFAAEHSFPTIARLCPVDSRSRRQKIKSLIADLQNGEKNANIRENIFKSLKHVNVDPIFNIEKHL